MKIVIMTPVIHFHSSLILRDMFEAAKETGNEFLVILTPKLSSNRKSSSSIGKIIKNTGLKYLIMMVLLKLKFDLFHFFEKQSSKPTSQKRYASPKEICKAYGVECKFVENINSDSSFEIISQYSPDVILSIFFNQIIKKSVLECASSAALNIHPSYLPEYRGMSPILWMLAENSKEGGVTIHHMEEEIDTGAIIIQKKFPIKKRDSFFNVYTKSGILGAELINNLLEPGNKIPEGKKQDKGESKYYGPLTKSNFKQALKNHPFLKF